MPGFIVEYTTKSGGLVVIESGTVKYWKGEGLPQFEGDLFGLSEYAPEVVVEMIERGIVKVTD
jgi:hypothetical protein